MGSCLSAIVFPALEWRKAKQIRCPGLRFRPRLKLPFTAKPIYFSDENKFPAEPF